MDSNVQTKTPNNRRTKYIFIGLVAVICVLSYQLYKENSAKKRLITRKTYLIGKLYECRVSSEKIETSLKQKKGENSQLSTELSNEKDGNDKLKKKNDELEGTLDKKEAELQTLHKVAVGINL
jgi:predicted nuclease with TOPRIM domain